MPAHFPALSGCSEASQDTLGQPDGTWAASWWQAVDGAQPGAGLGV